MRTLVISDLHLGLRSGSEVLRRQAALDVLLARLQDIDRLVLLGDLLELRHGPTRSALAVAEPVLRALGDALGAGREVVIVPGNHDHALVAGWLDWRGRREQPAPLGLDERISPERASWVAKRVAGFLAPADVVIAYPGIWLRDDVYAMHGHYGDVHLLVPTIERLTIGLMQRMVGAPPDPATADDYEALLAPIYAISQASAQRAENGRGIVGGYSAGGAWRALSGRGPRSRALRAGLRVAVATANRAGIGPVEPHVGVVDLRRAGLLAASETARRLRLAPAHLLLGHTHRSGPLPGDALAEWRTPVGTRLHNTGNWIYDGPFMTRRTEPTNPYWPGNAIVLDDGAPPRLERLLADLPVSVLLSAP